MYGYYSSMSNEYMRRRNQTLSRKIIFQDLDNIGTSADPVNFGDEHTKALQQLDGGMNNFQETAYDNVQLGSRMSSRRRFFQNLNNEEGSYVSKTSGNEDEDRLGQLSERKSNLGGSDNHNVQLGSRMSSRRRFFQNLNNEETSYVSKTSGNEDDDRLGQLSKRKSNLGGSDNHSMQLGGRRSSRNIYFCKLDKKETVAASKSFEDDHNMNDIATTMDNNNFRDEHADALRQLNDRINSPEERVENALDSLSSFGQANYQRQKQGIIIEYKDFGDSTFQCNHCNAYYWRDERNTRGVYTSCCKGGQILSHWWLSTKITVVSTHRYKIKVRLEDEGGPASTLFLYTRELRVNEKHA